MILNKNGTDGTVYFLRCCFVDCNSFSNFLLFHLYLLQHSI